MLPPVGKGLDLEAARREINVSAFEKQQGGDDPVRRYYFAHTFPIPRHDRLSRRRGWIKGVESARPSRLPEVVMKYLFVLSWAASY